MNGWVISTKRLVAVLDDLEEIATVVDLRAPARIVEHDEIEARERAHRLGVAAVATRERRTGARAR